MDEQTEPTGYIILRETAGGRFAPHDVVPWDADPEQWLRDRMAAAEIPGRWCLASFRLERGIDWPQGVGE